MVDQIREFGHSTLTWVAAVCVYQPEAVQNIHDDATEWFSTQFVASFAVLLKHKYHNQEVDLVHVQYPDSVLTPDDVTPLHKSTKQLLIYAHANSHYVVLLVDIATKKIMVHDGLKRAISHWAKHAFWALQKVGLLNINSTIRRCIDSSNPDGTPHKFRSAIPWKMTFKHLLTQKDGNSCGPIACSVIWHYLSNKKFEIPADHLVMRRSVCNEYTAFCQDFELDGSLRYQTNQIFINLAESCPNRTVDLLQDDSSTTSTEGFEDDGNKKCAANTNDNKKSATANTDGNHKHDAKCKGVPFTSKDSPARKRQKASDVPCVICLMDSCQPDTLSILVLACKHHAHIHCLMEWASFSNFCHMCRAPITHDVMKLAKELTKRKEQESQDSSISTLTQARTTSVEVHQRRKMLLEAKGRQRQTKQKAAMLKRFVHTRNLHEGDIVSVVVPKEVRARTTNIHLLGVVSAVSKTASVCVVVSDGLIVEKEKVHWLPPDKVEKKWDSTSYALSQQLREYRAQILDKSFDPATVPKISLAEAHRHLIDVKNQGMNRCKCKKGRCNNCVCARNNTLCYSGCGCGGRCTRTVQLSDELKRQQADYSSASQN